MVHDVAARDLSERQRESQSICGRGRWSVTASMVVIGVGLSAVLPLAASAAQEQEQEQQQQAGAVLLTVGEEEAAAVDGLGLHEVLAIALRMSPTLYGPGDSLARATIQETYTRSQYALQVTPYLSTGGEPYGTGAPIFGVNVSKRLPTGTEVRFTANTFAYDLAGIGYREGGYSFWLTHPLLQGFGPAPRAPLEDARRGVESAQRGFDMAQQQLVLNVARAYFGIVRLQRLVQASELALERAARLKTASEARMRVGLATRLDVLRADLFSARAQATLADRMTALEDQTDGLKLLLGRALGVELRIAGDDIDDYSNPSALEDAGVVLNESADPMRVLVSTAMTHRIDVREARDRVADANRSASVAKWSLLPRLDFTAGYSQRNIGSPFARNLDDLYGGFRIGLTSSYSLDRSGEVANFDTAALSVRAEERALVDLNQRVAAEVRHAYRAMRRAEVTTGIQAQALDMSEQQLRLAQLRYERGLAGNFDVVDAESNLFESQSSLISARVDHALAGLALELAMGLLEPASILR